MKLIIAGSRRLIIPVSTIDRAIECFSLEPTQVVSGMATGVDTAGKIWAIENKIPVVPFPAFWGILDSPGAVIKERADGTLYNAFAGSERNQKMADYADRLLVIKREDSKGTDDMIRRMKIARKPIYIFWVET